MSKVIEENPRMGSLVGTVRKLSAEEKIAQACESRRRYLQDIATYNEEIQQIKKERDRLAEERDRLAEERDRLAEERDRLAEERDQLLEKIKILEAELERKNG